MIRIYYVSSLELTYGFSHHTLGNSLGWLAEQSEWWADGAHKYWTVIHLAGGYTEYQSTTALGKFLQEQRLGQQSPIENLGGRVSEARKAICLWDEDSKKETWTIKVGRGWPKLHRTRKWTSTHHSAFFTTNYILIRCHSYGALWPNGRDARPHALKESKHDRNNKLCSLFNEFTLYFLFPSCCFLITLLNEFTLYFFFPSCCFWITLLN